METVQKVADALAARLGQGRVQNEPTGDLDGKLRRAIDSALSGRLIESTPLLETSIAESLDAMHRVERGNLVLDASVALAAIELARQQEDRAQELLARVLELDPGFELLPHEKSPRLIAAFRAAQKAQDKSLRVATLGKSCRDGASILIVARGGRDGRIELFRYDGCRLLARVRATAGDSPELLARHLDPSSTAEASPKPLYKQWWFWAGAGAAVATGTVAAYFLLREEPTTDVVILPRVAW